MTRDRIAGWAHRRGLARTLSTSGNNANRIGTALIQTKGPRWLGDRLWRFALLSGYMRGRIVLNSLRVTDVRRISGGIILWDVTFMRAP